MAQLDNELMQFAREFLEAVTGELDPYSSEKGEIKQESSTRITLFSPQHIHFAKYGRGPGKPPPLDPILKWVKREGIIIGDSTEEGSAWAIVNSISKKGTSNWQPGAPDAIEEAVNLHLNEMDEKMAKQIAISFQDNVLREIYDATFEPLRKIKL